MTPTQIKQGRPGTWFPGLFFMAATRPHLLLPAWLAAVTGASFKVRTEGVPPLELPTLMAGLVAWSLSLLAVNLINLIADQQTDLINDKNQGWKRGLKATHLAAGAAMMSLSGLVLAAWVVPCILLPLLLGLGLGVAYSQQPPRLSARPGWDLLAHVAGYGIIAPWIGAVLVVGPDLSATRSVTPTSGIPLAALLYLAPVVAITFLLTALLDLSGDRAAGKKSSVVWLVDRFPLMCDWARNHLTRRIIIVLVFLGVVLAGLPGMLAWPGLAVPMACWLVMSYALQGLISNRL